MILQTLLNVFHTLLSSMIASLPPWDFAVNNNQAFMCLVRYSYSLSNFIPVTEAILPIVALKIIINGFMLARRIVVAIFNALRGAGLR